ncbi:MAG TPA: hypothetical protein VHG93_01995 [Longimicrobium sp.]|nr:hypothetical protein [Longimicrobium sp.]
MRTLALAITLAAVLMTAACDTPASPDLNARLVELIEEPIVKRLGEIAYLEVEIGNRFVRTARVVDPIALVWQDELSFAWLVKCQAVGTSRIGMALADGSGAEVEIFCEEPEEILAWVETPLDLDEHFGEGIVQFSVSGHGGAFIGVTQGGTQAELTCHEAGTFKYLLLRFEGTDAYKWYRVKCEFREFPIVPMQVGIPVNVEALFREADGREVVWLDALPGDLAMHVAIGENLWAELSGTTVFSSVGFDSGLVCKRVGTGVLHVYFTSTDVPDHEVYSLTCRAQHDQGGGG